MTKPKPLPKIAPCPWCGSTKTMLWMCTGTVSKSLDTGQQRAFCDACLSAGPHRWSDRGAINAWNRLPRFTREDLRNLHECVAETHNESVNKAWNKELHILFTKLEGML